VGYRPETPFDHIESAHQYVDLLAEAVDETLREIDADLAAMEGDSERRRKAMMLVSYNLSKLSSHMRSSRRILNDLRTLRRLLLSERRLAAAAGVSATENPDGTAL
jgi:hypothetical protein